VDEIQYGKGHKYLTLVYQIEQECTRLLWVGKERTVESFEQFFTLIGAPLSKKIEYVCSDMCKPYLRVIRERCSNAVNILGRFHIVAKMNKALDEVRAGEARRLAQQGYEPVLKRTRWCVLKRKTNLTGKQRFRLRELLRYNLKTARAYLLKEDFQQFREYGLATWAGKFLDDWCHSDLLHWLDARAHDLLMIGAEAGEVMATVQTAMMAGLPYPTMRDAILTHPTMAEGLGLLFENVPPRSASTMRYRVVTAAAPPTQ
jgi:transposase